MSKVNESDLPKEVIELRDLIVSRLVDAGFQKDEETYGFNMVYSYPCPAKPSSRPSVFIICHYQSFDGSVVKKGYYVNAQFRGIIIGWDCWDMRTPHKPIIKCDNSCFEGQSVDSIRLDMLDSWIKHQKELVTLFEKFDKDFKKSKKGDYYCSICCDSDVPEMEHTGECIGIDLGIKSSIVMSNGETINNPHFEAKSERKIKHLQRKLAKAKKGGSRYEKVRIALAAAHEKLGNRRSNFLHQVSHKLVRDYDIICMENLNIKGMQKNHCLAGALSSQALGTLSRMIEYKAQWHNRTVVKVGRFFPSSQLCNNCGHRHHTLKLSDREWICPVCGSVIDRDLNAAKNILDEGLRILDNEGTPRTGEAVVLKPLCLAENPTVDDRLCDLKSSGAVMREIQLVAPEVTETHRSLAGG